MESSSLAGYLLFIVSLVVFVGVQRLLHREIQGFLMIIFRNPRIVIALFSFILLPGVFIHELSHWLTAVLLRVPVLKFSLIPEAGKSGQLRMGFVQTRKCDPIRDSLIGLAPFVFGMLIIGWIGSSQLGLNSVVSALFEGNAGGTIDSFLLSIRQADYWIWMYLAFSISSAMLPSSSDRQSWKPILIGVIIVIFGLLLVGLGDWLLLNLSPKLAEWLRLMAIVLASSTIIHLIILFPTWASRLLISRLTGIRLVRVP